MLENSWNLGKSTAECKSTRIKISILVAYLLIDVRRIKMAAKIEEEWNAINTTRRPSYSSPMLSDGQSPIDLEQEV